MKRFSTLMIIMILVLSLILVGCSSSEEEVGQGAGNKPEESVSAADAYPEKPINVIIAYSAGGNTDIAARILLPLVEEQLGVPMNVINKPGGGGWTGWTDFLNAPRDGYTIGYINTPNLFTGYLNPEFNRDNTIDDFVPIANHVLDYGAIAVNSNDTRFETIEDLIEYAKENEVTGTTTGFAGDDHIAQLRINDALGTQFVPVHQAGTSEMLHAVIGGHVDVFFDNVGSVTSAERNGELRALAVLAPERSKFLPDVPTFGESGYPEIVTSSARGLAFASGVDQEIVDKVTEAFVTALNDPEHVKKIEDLGYLVQPYTGEEYEQFLRDDEAGIIAIKDVLGW